MTEKTTPADNNSANTLEGNNTTTSNGTATKRTNRVSNKTKKKKDKKKGKPTRPPFQGLSKEEVFKGVVIDAGKPAIQARNLCDAVWKHSNNKNQPVVADSVKYKKPLMRRQFVTARLDPSNYMVDRDDGTGGQVKDPALKRTEELSVDHLIKHQSLLYNTASTFVHMLWNIAWGQCSETIQLELERKGTELGLWDNCRDDKDLLQLLNLIDIICDNGSSGTNEDEIYVCISQAQRFHTFSQQSHVSASKYVRETTDMYDTYKNRVGDMPFGNALMVRIISKKHNTTNAQQAMELYYDTTRAALKPGFDLAYKERYLSRFIIANGDMKEGRDEMLHNQSICGTKPFEIGWGQSMSLLNCECQKTRRARNKKSNKGRQQCKMVMRKPTTLYNAY